MNAVAPLPTPSTARAVGNFERGETRTEVSKQWIARPADQKFLSLDELHASVKARSDATFERRVDTRKLEIFAPDPKTVEDTHKMFLGLPDGEAVAPTHWSFGQIAGLAKAPAGYLRTLPSPIAADALAYGLRYNREGESVKLYGRDGLDLRAATGPEYGRIFDHEVVGAVRQIAGNGTGDTRWKVPGTLDWSTGLYDPETPVTKDTTTLFASDRDVFVFLVDDRNPISVGTLPNGEPDLMFRGFYVSNSEVGSAALKIAAFYLRAVCCNRILWGVEHFEEVSMRHSRYAPSRFLEEARPALSAFAEGSEARLIDGVRKAKAAKVAENDEDAIAFLAARKFSQKRITEIMETVEREEGRPMRSAWDAAQGITAVARSIPPHRRPDRLRARGSENSRSGLCLIEPLGAAPGQAPALPRPVPLSPGAAAGRTSRPISDPPPSLSVATRDATMPRKRSHRAAVPDAPSETTCIRVKPAAHALRGGPRLAQQGLARISLPRVRCLDGDPKYSGEARA